MLRSKGDPSKQIDFIDRIADNTAAEHELGEFASGLDLERGSSKRLRSGWSCIMHDHGLTWKPKELLLLRCDADVVAECAIAMKARRGLIPKTSAVKAVWHPQEGSSQAGRGPAQEAAAAGIRGATAKEELSARGVLRPEMFPSELEQEDEEGEEAQLRQEELQPEGRAEVLHLD